MCRHNAVDIVKPLYVGGGTFQEGFNAGFLVNFPNGAYRCLNCDKYLTPIEGRMTAMLSRPKGLSDYVFWETIAINTQINAIRRMLRLDRYNGR